MGILNWIFSLVFIISASFACEGGSSFTGASKNKKSKEERPKPPREAEATAPDEEPDIATNNEGKFTKTLSSATDPVVDYLFVVDNSVSMGKIIQQLKDGFRAISERGEFPENSRVGIMSTAVPESSGGKNVGFLTTVTKSSIAQFRGANQVAQFPGCEDENGLGWFDPQEKDAAGNYCLESAVNFNLKGLGIEAGISSFKGFIENNKNYPGGKPAFREGAAVNIIFVSDTHGPGVNNGGAVRKVEENTKLADFEKLLLNRNNDVIDLRFHGIVPQRGDETPQGTVCSNEAVHSFAYLPLIAETKGLSVSCSIGPAEYPDFISRMIQESKKVDTTITLRDSIAPDKIIKVVLSIEGKETELSKDEWSISKNGKSLVIKEEVVPESGEVKATIYYTKA